MRESCKPDPIVVERGHNAFYAGFVVCSAGVSLGYRAVLIYTNWLLFVVLATD